MNIDANLVARLIAKEFPEWVGLQVIPVKESGWDNHSFRLGQALLVRLPSAARYAGQVEKEQEWLPKLAPHLPLPVPVPVGKGNPAEGYPWKWSIYRWLDGETLSSDKVTNTEKFAEELAQFLNQLHSIDSSGGPVAGAHNFFRGGSLEVYDEETQRSIGILKGDIDSDAVMSLWSDAVTPAWSGPPVWVHGDVATGNLLVKESKLCAVIDFGCLGVGDPACDLVIAWTFLCGEGRRAFQRAMNVDQGAWVRARGWAVWKALITIVEYKESCPAKSSDALRVLVGLLKDRDCQTP